MKAIILAGGRGTRLAPYTTVLPKPLMPLGEKPILEIVIKQLRYYGFKEVILAVGYLSELIKAYFGDGSSLGVKIRYSKEKAPLGTVGPLSLIDNLNDTFVLMNGDVLTSLSFSKLIKYHKAKRSVATIAISHRNLDVNYGIIELKKDNLLVDDYIEKPRINYNVSMGIYVFEPKVMKYIPKNKKLDFPQLILKLLKNNEKVISYKSKDKWLDIGRHDDYALAQKEFKTIINHLLPKGKIIL